jgi:phosphoribosylaminoimidazole-succinocarboxamide synthase
MSITLTENTLVHKGSVKNIHSIDDFLYFQFSDRYSVFDWGEMPDAIDKKGEALCDIADRLFQILGTPTLLKQFLPESNKILKDFPKSNALLYQVLEEGFSHHSHGRVFISPEQSLLKVKPVEVIHPTLNDNHFNYSVYSEKPINTLVPLEVIFRWGVPKGSSLLNTNKDHTHIKHFLGEPEIYAGMKFAKPYIEFSTKLEPTDRMLSYSEAKKVAGLTDQEFQTLIDTTSLIAMALKNIFEKTGRTLWDGKVEYAYSGDQANRFFEIVDSIGPDELRLTQNGKILSKELMRQYYRSTPWFKELTTYKFKHPHNFKDIMIKDGHSPHQLPSDIKSEAIKIYTQLANDLKTITEEL